MPSVRLLIPYVRIDSAPAPRASPVKLLVHNNARLRKLESRGSSQILRQRFTPALYQKINHDSKLHALSRTRSCWSVRTESLLVENDRCNADTYTASHTASHTLISSELAFSHCAAAETLTTGPDTG